MLKRLVLIPILAAAAAALALPARAADLIVSANDGKFVRVEGRNTFPDPPPAPDSLVVIDGEKSPPAVIATVEGIEHTIQGPPQAVAITPDGKLAVVGAPSRYDYAAKKEIFDTFLQIVDLEASPPKLIEKVEIGSHPNGLSISPDGTLLLAATLTGDLAVLSISGKNVKPLDRVKLGTRRLSGVAFTHDGKSALVGLRDDQGIVVLDVSGTTVKPTGDRISTGVCPYAIDVSSDGRWAVASDAGLACLPPDPGRFIGDVDAVTLIDVSNRPFRAVRHITVPATPEGAALSPDGKWIAVQCLNGSNLTADNPGRQKLGKVLLFAVNDDGTVTKTAELPSGEAAQGLVFTRDSRYVIVQFDVERALAVYEVQNRTLVDTGQRIKLAAGPVSIRSMPR